MGITQSICQKQGKGISDIPKSVYNVRDIRNSGWPTGGDAYGHGVLVGVDGVTSIQGERENRSQGDAG